MAQYAQEASGALLISTELRVDRLEARQTANLPQANAVAARDFQLIILISL
jgi:hypothetical protein